MRRKPSSSWCSAWCGCAACLDRVAALLSCVHEHPPRGRESIYLLAAGGLNLKSDRLGVALGDGDRCRLLAQLLVPGLDLVRARRQIGELELPVVAGDGIERVGDHHGVRRHPGVHVALDLETALRACRRRARTPCGGRHRHVELRVHIGQRVDVVQDAVGIEHLERLPRATPRTRAGCRGSRSGPSPSDPWAADRSCPRAAR